MWSKLPLLHSCPGGVHKSTFHGPWRREGRRSSGQQQVGFEMNNKSWFAAAAIEQFPEQFETVIAVAGMEAFFMSGF
jgi:hypothetical protein